MQPSDHIFALLLVVVGVGALLWHLRRKRLRRLEMTRWARHAGWQELERNDPQVRSTIEGSALSRMHGSIASAFRAPPETGDAALVIDYAYTTGPTGQRRSVRQTVIGTPVDSGLPRITISPRQGGVLHALLGRDNPGVGEQVFDERYSVEVEDAAWPDLPRRFISMLRDIQEAPDVEVAGGWMLIYRRGRLIAPAGVRTAIDEAIELARELKM